MTLDLYTQRLDDALDTLVESEASDVFAVNPSDGAVAWCRERGIRVWGRLTGEWDNGLPEDVITPEDYAEILCAQPWTDHAYAVSLPNEPHPGDPFWMASAVREIRRRKPHLRVLVGNWGVGWDGFLVPVAEEDEPYTIYCSHEYGDPRDPRLVMSGEGYHALRHQGLGQPPHQGGWFERLVRPVQPWATLVIGEMGLTDAANIVTGEERDEGWLRYGVDEERYWLSALEYFHRLRSYVVKVFWFDAFVHPPWESHELAGTGLLERWKAWRMGRTPVLGHPGQPTGIVEVEVKEGESDDMAAFVLGFKSLAEHLGADVVGEPEVDEKTLKNPDGSNVITVQLTTKGVMVYMDGAQPIFLPGKA